MVRGGSNNSFLSLNEEAKLYVFHQPDEPLNPFFFPLKKEELDTVRTLFKKNKNLSYF